MSLMSTISLDITYVDESYLHNYDDDASVWRITLTNATVDETLAVARKVGEPYLVVAVHALRGSPFHYSFDTMSPAQLESLLTTVKRVCEVSGDLTAHGAVTAVNCEFVAALLRI